MKLRAFILITLVALGVASFGTAAPTASARQQINLNSEWAFHYGETPGAESVAFDASSWSHLNLPHTWNALDGQDGTKAAQGGALLMRGDYARGTG